METLLNEEAETLALRMGVRDRLLQAARRSSYLGKYAGGKMLPPEGTGEPIWVGVTIYAKQAPVWIAFIGDEAPLMGRVIEHLLPEEFGVTLFYEKECRIMPQTNN